jgi:MinD-like ATPase involved in chromosome partitioning or flagellar assembly
MNFNPNPGWRRSSRWRAPASDGEPFDAGLSFRALPGPLLAVAGLSGGAGASVLAYLIAATAAAQSRAPVLLADTGGPTAGLAAYTATSSPQTLAGLSERLSRDEAIPAGFWGLGEHGLRVLAGDPQFSVPGDDDAIRRVLQDARAAHSLTVVDGGTLARTAEQVALSIATHIAWVLPATASGVARARRVLSRVTALSRPEILVARAEPGTGKPPVSDLADLADERRAPLVLMPYLGDVAAGSARELADDAALALQAVGGLLHR